MLPAPPTPSLSGFGSGGCRTTWNLKVGWSFVPAGFWVRVLGFMMASAGWKRTLFQHFLALLSSVVSSCSGKPPPDGGENGPNNSQPCEVPLCLRSQKGRDSQFSYQSRDCKSPRVGFVQQPPPSPLGREGTVPKIRASKRVMGRQKLSDT